MGGSGATRRPGGLFGDASGPSRQAVATAAPLRDPWDRLHCESAGSAPDRHPAPCCRNRGSLKSAGSLAPPPTGRLQFWWVALSRTQDTRRGWVVCSRVYFEPRNLGHRRPRAGGPDHGGGGLLRRGCVSQHQRNQRRQHQDRDHNGSDNGSAPSKKEEQLERWPTSTASSPGETASRRFPSHQLFFHKQPPSFFLLLLGRRGCGCGSGDGIRRLEGPAAAPTLIACSRMSVAA